jgi:hypothetical protein
MCFCAAKPHVQVRLRLCLNEKMQSERIKFNLIQFHYFSLEKHREMHHENSCKKIEKK